MTITTPKLHVQTSIQPSNAPEAPMPALNPRTLPQGPGGLTPRTHGSSGGSSQHGTDPSRTAAPPFVSYPTNYGIPGGGSKTKVALDSSFSKDQDARLTAHRVVMEAACETLLKQTMRKTEIPPNSPLAQLASGALDHVYVDSKHFADLSRAARRGEVHGRPERYPVFVDGQRNQLVVDMDRAFAAGDRLSEQGRRGLKEALGLDPSPRYAGHKIDTSEKGASFFKANDHSLLNGTHPDPTAFVHPNYYSVPNTKALGADIAVHRGLIDNRAGIPENSLSAIQAAYDAGYRHLELDVQVTADGKPVMLHDFTTGRMTNDAANSLVSHVKFDDITRKNLVIRNPVDGNFVETDQRVAGIEQALLDIARTKPGMSIALDCKETTGEAAFNVLRAHPELREFTALKLYSKAYAGGFDQFLGNLYKQNGIDPKSPQDRPRREELMKVLEQVKVVPVFSQEVLNQPQVKQFFPARDAKLQETGEGLAQTAQAWLNSWTVMKPVVVEAVSTDTETAAGRGMAKLNKQFADEKNPYHGVATSAAYRYEDFSLNSKQGDKQYYTWQIFGGMTNVTDDKWAVNRGTAGAFRHDGDALLTDQPDEEALAKQLDQRLQRGHTGLVLDVPDGTQVPMARDAAVVKERVSEFMAEKKEHAADPQLIADVRAGREADRLAAAKEGPTSAPGASGVAALAAVGTVAMVGAAAYVATRPGLRGNPGPGDRDHSA